MADSVVSAGSATDATNWWHTPSLASRVTWICRWRLDVCGWLALTISRQPRLATAGYTPWLPSMQSTSSETVSMWWRSLIACMFYIIHTSYVGQTNNKHTLLLNVNINIILRKPIFHSMQGNVIVRANIHLPDSDIFSGNSSDIISLYTGHHDVFDNLTIPRDILSKRRRWEKWKLSGGKVLTCLEVELLFVWIYVFYVSEGTAFMCLDVRLLCVWRYGFYVSGGTAFTCLEIRLFVSGGTAFMCLEVRLLCLEVRLLCIWR